MLRCNRPAFVGSRAVQVERLVFQKLGQVFPREALRVMRAADRTFRRYLNNVVVHTGRVVIIRKHQFFQKLPSLQLSAVVRLHRHGSDTMPAKNKKRRPAGLDIHLAAAAHVEAHRQACQ